MMMPQLLKLLLQPAAFIYEQCGQPIIVCVLAQYYSPTGFTGSLGNLAQAVTHCACHSATISEQRFIQLTGIGIYFIAAIIKKHGSLLLLVYCYLKLFFFPICMLPSWSFQETLSKLYKGYQLHHYPEHQIASSTVMTLGGTKGADWKAVKKSLYLWNLVQ